MGGGARPGGLHDQPLRELIDKVQQALQTQASYQVNMLEAPDDYLLAQLYLTSDGLSVASVCAYVSYQTQCWNFVPHKAGLSY